MLVSDFTLIFLSKKKVMAQVSATTHGKLVVDRKPLDFPTHASLKRALAGTVEKVLPMKDYLAVLKNARDNVGSSSAVAVKHNRRDSLVGTTATNTIANQMDPRLDAAVADAEKLVATARAALRADDDMSVAAFSSATLKLQAAADAKDQAVTAAVTAQTATTETRLARVAPSSESTVVAAVTTIFSSISAISAAFDITTYSELSANNLSARLCVALAASTPRFTAAMGFDVSILQYAAICKAVSDTLFAFWIKEQGYSADELTTARLAAVDRTLRTPILPGQAAEQVRVHLEALHEQRGGAETAFDIAYSVHLVCESVFQKFVDSNYTVNALAAVSNIEATMVELARRFLASSSRPGPVVAAAGFETLHMQVAALQAHIAQLQSSQQAQPRLATAGAAPRAERECNYCLKRPALQANASTHGRSECTFGYVCNGCGAVGKPGAPVGHTHRHCPVRPYVDR